MNEPRKLAPLLVCRDALAALDFYAATLDVRVTDRRLQPSGVALAHADLEGEGIAFSVTEEARGWNSDAPPSLGGSPVVLQLAVADVDALFARMLEAGATVVFPIQTFDQRRPGPASRSAGGVRMGRLRNPFGHLWLLSQRPKTA